MTQAAAGNGWGLDNMHYEFSGMTGIRYPVSVLRKTQKPLLRAREDPEKIAPHETGLLGDFHPHLSDNELRGFP